MHCTISAWLMAGAFFDLTKGVLFGKSCTGVAQNILQMKKGLQLFL